VAEEVDARTVWEDNINPCL